MTRSSFRRDAAADLDWSVTVCELDSWAIPARGHGVRYLQSRPAGLFRRILRALFA